jgi:hypothetical protein
LPETHGNNTPGFLGYFASDWPIAYLTATVICCVGILVGSFTHISSPDRFAATPKATNATTSPSASGENRAVGRITGMHDCVWKVSGDNGRETGAGRQPTPSPILHASVLLDDCFDLRSGLLEITYDTGAKVILQGPVKYAVESAAGGYLSIGKLTARLEKKVCGGEQRTVGKGTSLSSIPAHPSPLFSVRTPTATVTDLGTEFGVEVTKDCECHLTVFQGEVALKPHASGATSSEAIHLRRDEAASVLSSGIVTRHAPSSNASNSLAATFTRTIPGRMETPNGVSRPLPNPIDKMPGLLYHLDAARSVTLDDKGHVRLWGDQSKNHYTFVRAWQSELLLIAAEPAFNHHPAIRNTTTNIAGLCLQRETSPRSVIIVQRTFDAGRAGGIWGHTECHDIPDDCGVRRANPHPERGWVVLNATRDDFAFQDHFYINGFATHLQEVNAPGILEAYGANPSHPVFNTTSIFGYTRLLNGTRWWQGDIAELIAFDRVLTQAERATIVRYLGAKYKIATAFDVPTPKPSQTSSNSDASMPPAGKEKTP